MTPSTGRAALAGLCLTALALGACSGRSQAEGANGRICFDFKAAKPVAVAGAPEGAGVVDDCLRRWAYSLAPSRDAADAVANAVTIACSAKLSYWNQQTLQQPGAEDTSASLITGEPTTPLGEHNAFAHRQALLYVVQARAGTCAPPPAVAGTPEGTAG
ncbi:hypothetical protein [Phenylobacterium sp.]|uniref:hypothetical protein n=1 Tax=Phenylobacterium sp. TaxID=1871053 RepID=UPI0025F65435|nr:hypothetical protein [Phenylobacterium sp.]